MGPHGARWRFGIRRIANPATFVCRIAFTQTMRAIWRAMFGATCHIPVAAAATIIVRHPPPLPSPAEWFIHLWLIATLGPDKLTVEMAHEVIDRFRDWGGKNRHIPL